MNANRPQSTSTLALYAMPAISISMLLMPPIMYIPPFYASEVSMDLATVGLVFFLARAWDAFIDPLIGSLSDHTRSRWGRRKPWIAVGVPFLMLATWLLFSPPQAASPAYLLIVIFGFYLAWTMVQIPYLSWGAELSTDYKERNRIVGFREAGTMIGVLLITGLPALIFYGSEPTLRQILMAFAVLILVSLPVTCLLALRKVPDVVSDVREEFSMGTVLRTLVENRPFLRLMVATLLIWLGAYIYNACILFVLQNALGFPGSVFLQLVFIQFLVGTLFTPLIIRGANRFGKHRVLAISAVATALVIPAMSLVPAGSFVGIAACFVALGFAISPIWVLPTAIVADVADVGELLGGGRKNGLYMAIYNLDVKIAIAISIGVAMPLLGYLGFQPTGAVTEAGRQALSIVGLYLPAALMIAGAAVLWNYPLDAKAHGEIRRRLEPA